MFKRARANQADPVNACSMIRMNVPIMSKCYTPCVALSCYILLTCPAKFFDEQLQCESIQLLIYYHCTNGVRWGKLARMSIESVMLLEMLFMRFDVFLIRGGMCHEQRSC